MNAVDEALGSTVTTLEALATARSLAQGHLKEFDAEARRVLATQPDWKDIIILAPDGRQLVFEFLPFRLLDHLRGPCVVFGCCHRLHYPRDFSYSFPCL